jgi:glycosyltransferase involved in cell wall biosynthesis
LARRYSDPRVRLLTQTNQGAAVALAAGIRESKGEYVAVLDQDDLWHTDYLSAHMAVQQQQEGVDLTFSWFQVINENGDPIGLHSRRYREALDFGYLLEDCVIAGSSNVVARRAALEKAGGVDLAIGGLYDLDLCLRIALLRPRNIQPVTADLMFYRRHKAQMTSGIRSLQQEWDRVLDKIMLLAPEKVAPRQQRARSNVHRYWARLAYESGDFAGGLDFLRKGFTVAPSYFLTDSRNWTTLAACLCGFVLPPRAHRALERMAGLKIRD